MSESSWSRRKMSTALPPRVDAAGRPLMSPPRLAQLYQPASWVHMRDSRPPSVARAKTFMRVPSAFATAAGALVTVTVAAFRPMLDQAVVQPLAMS